MSVQLNLTSDKLPEVSEEFPLSEQVMGWYDASSFDYMRYSLNSGWKRCHGLVGDRPAPYKNPVAWNEIVVPDYDERRRVIGDAK